MKPRLSEAHRLLAEVYQVLDEYAPVWYSADLRDRLWAELTPRGSEKRRHESNPRMLSGSGPIGGARRRRSLSR